MGVSVDLAVNAGTGSGPPVTWPGGKAAVIEIGATNIDLEILGPDGSTWVLVENNTSANISILDLPEGTYRVTVNGGSNVYVRMVSVDRT